jgi:hypothetical protein
VATEPSKSLLIAILALSAANLLVSAVQTGIMLRQPTQGPSATSRTSLPSQYTDAVLTQLAGRVTEPYNRGDNEALYNALDDVAKNQISREKLVDQVTKLKELLGTVSSVSYAGFETLPSEGGMQLYRLNYSVKLSGKVPSGVMQITVLDRPSRPGIVGFFVYGRTQ